MRRAAVYPRFGLYIYYANISRGLPIGASSRGVCIVPRTLGVSVWKAAKRLACRLKGFPRMRAEGLTRRAATHDRYSSDASSGENTSK